MNRSSALSIIFCNDEAGHVGGDEPEDCVEEDSDSDDEIEVDYAQLDVAEAIKLEEQLMGTSPTQHLDSLELVVQRKKESAADQRKTPLLLHQLFLIDQQLLTHWLLVIFFQK